jgi:hypothetical protein
VLCGPFQRYALHDCSYRLPCHCFCSFSIHVFIAFGARFHCTYLSHFVILFGLAIANRRAKLFSAHTIGLPCRRTPQVYRSVSSTLSPLRNSFSIRMNISHAGPKSMSIPMYVPTSCPCLKFISSLYFFDSVLCSKSAFKPIANSSQRFSVALSSLAGRCCLAKSSRIESISFVTSSKLSPPAAFADSVGCVFFVSLILFSVMGFNLRLSQKCNKIQNYAIDTIQYNYRAA